MTFDEIERRTDRTFAYAILVRFASNYIACVIRLREVCGALDQLLGILTPEGLETLTPEQTSWLTARLQEVHRLLAGFSRSPEAESIGRLPILGGLTTRAQDATEDLDDIIADLVLRNNPDFTAMISDCASSIGLSSGETVGRMHP